MWCILMLQWWLLLWHLLKLISRDCWLLDSRWMLKWLMFYWRKNQSIWILTTIVVEAMRCTIYIRTERTRKRTRLHGTRGTTRLCSHLNATICIAWRAHVYCFLNHGA
jgi:hypothetical protein